MVRVPRANSRSLRSGHTDAATFFDDPRLPRAGAISPRFNFGLAALPTSYAPVFGVGTTRHAVTPHKATRQDCPVAGIAERTTEIPNDIYFLA